MFFLNEQQLFDLKQSYDFYKDKPFAYIFYAEMVRKGIFDNTDEDVFFMSWFRNFFAKMSDETIEVLFPDTSFLTFNFKEKMCYVMQSNTGFYKVFNFYNFD